MDQVEIMVIQVQTVTMDQMVIIAMLEIIHVMVILEEVDLRKIRNLLIKAGLIFNSKTIKKATLNDDKDTNNKWFVITVLDNRRKENKNPRETAFKFTVLLLIHFLHITQYTSIDKVQRFIMCGNMQVYDQSR